MHEQVRCRCAQRQMRGASEQRSEDGRIAVPFLRKQASTGAALYYIVSGTGANTVGGKTEQRGPGSWVYEPFGLVHQWGNPGDEPLTILAFNINPDGVPAVVTEAAATHKW